MTTLLFYCAGCTYYAPDYLPGDEPPPSDSAEIVEVGVGIRMTLHSGEVVDGKVLEITKDSLVFGKPSNYGMEK